ncbi:MAG: AI-2E family transporter, partial [Nitriliruptor sp.]
MDASDDPIEPGGSGAPGSDRQPTLVRVGRYAWALVGIALILALLGYVASALTIVVIPVVLALFPASLLAPVTDRLARAGLPRAAAALVTVLGALAVFFGVLAGVIALVVSQLPDLLDSAAEGVGQLEGLLEDDPLGIGVEGFGDALAFAQEQLGEAGDVAGQASSAALVAVEFVAGLLLMTVVLFFYLKDGRQLRDA